MAHNNVLKAFLFLYMTELEKAEEEFGLWNQNSLDLHKRTSSLLPHFTQNRSKSQRANDCQGQVAGARRSSNEKSLHGLLYPGLRVVPRQHLCALTVQQGGGALSANP